MNLVLWIAALAVFVLITCVPMWLIRPKRHYDPIPEQMENPAKTVYERGLAMRDIEYQNRPLPVEPYSPYRVNLGEPGDATFDLSPAPEPEQPVAKAEIVTSITRNRDDHGRFVKKA
jgi:hypothetical protein